MKPIDKVLFDRVQRKPREIRRDAKLAHATEAQQQQIEQWFKEEGEQACLQHIREKLGISICHSTFWDTLHRWRARARFLDFEAKARAQVEAEAEKIGGMSLVKMEEAVDRRFIMLASEKEDPKLYKEMRYLRIADKAAKNSARIATAKLKQDDQKLAQRNKALELAERKVVLLEDKIEEAKQATENKTLSAEERARRVREILR